MNLHVKKSLALIGLALAAGALAPNVALAQSSGVYLGGGIGQSKARDGCGALGGIGFTGSCDDTDTAWKIFGGYQINPNFAIEAGYVDLGKFRASGLGLTAESKAKTWLLDAVGILPLANNFSVLGKAGLHRWDADTRVVSGASASDKGTDFTFGFGAGYEFNPNLGLRLEWERFQKVGRDATTGKSDVDLLSLGLRYRF